MWTAAGMLIPGGRSRVGTLLGATTGSACNGCVVDLHRAYRSLRTLTLSALTTRD